MTLELFNEADMSIEQSKGWIALSQNNKEPTNVSIMLAWEDVDGDTLNGTIDVKVSNDAINTTPTFYTIIKENDEDTHTITVSSASNLTDASVINITNCYKFISVTYTPVDIETGKLYGVLVADKG